MPEGDVVWRAARQLHGALAGRVLTSSDFRVPRFAAADLTGSTVTAAVSRGKHLLIRTDDGQTVHSHLRMDGSWRIRPAGGPPPADHRVRLVLGNDDWLAVGYLLAMVEVLPSKNEHAAVGHLGPDLLGPDWDSAEAVRRLRLQPDRPIGEALLDQRNLAGIGNVYKCEVLFLRGLSPWRPAGQIDDAGALVKLARRLLDANKDRTGHITTGSTRRGEENWVYGRPGRPCRRCGTPVSSAGHAAQREDPQERVTFWCPRCQPDAGG
jgi:endonuclease-8